MRLSEAFPSFTCILCPVFPSCRYLSDEGIAELKGSAEKITHSDIIRIALDVSATQTHIQNVFTV